MVAKETGDEGDRGRFSVSIKETDRRRQGTVLCLLVTPSKESKVVRRTVPVTPPEGEKLKWLLY